MDELQKQQQAQLKRAELDALVPIPFEELENVIRKWMIIPDKGIIKLLCAHYITNSLARKAVWMIIIAPSGGGKTELLNGLLSLSMIYEVSLLTPNTFLSGMPGPTDASLLPKVNGKVLLFKDWTSVMSMQWDALSELMSQFREIWDGGMTKIFGNGKIRKWEGKVSILAASTQAVDMNQQMFTFLGERFLNYRIIMPERKEVAMRSLNNDVDQELMGWEIKKAFYAFMKNIDFKNLPKQPTLPLEIKEQLVDLADFCSMARSGIIRDNKNHNEVKFVPAAEMPTRIVQQLNSLVSSMMIMNGNQYKDSDMDIIYKVALDSIPQTNKMVIREMARKDERTTSEIAVSLGYPTGPIKLYLENLALLKVCKRIKGGDSEEGGNADRWTLRVEFKEIIKRYEGVEELSEEEKKVFEERNEVDEAFDNM